MADNINAVIECFSPHWSHTKKGFCIHEAYLFINKSLAIGITIQDHWNYETRFFDCHICCSGELFRPLCGRLFPSNRVDDFFRPFNSNIHSMHSGKIYMINELIGAMLNPIPNTGNKSFEIGFGQRRKEFQIGIGFKNALDGFNQFCFCHGHALYMKHIIKTILSFR